LRYLKYFDLHGNDFTSKLDDIFAQLQNPIHVDFSCNQLQWSLAWISDNSSVAHYNTWMLAIICYQGLCLRVIQCVSFTSWMCSIQVTVPWNVECLMPSLPLIDWRDGTENKHLTLRSSDFVLLRYLNMAIHI
jgi:hypothetical protein